MGEDMAHDSTAVNQTHRFADLGQGDALAREFQSASGGTAHGLPIDWSGVVNIGELGWPPALGFLHHNEARLVSPRIFTSNAEVPGLQLPEGITAWDGHVFSGTYNYTNPGASRIFVFDSKTGALQHTIGGDAGQELVSAGPILGLTINPQTGDLFASSNGTGNILRIEDPASGA